MLPTLSSITCKLFGIEKKELCALKIGLKRHKCNGRGMAQFDKYAGEVLVMADDINIVPKSKWMMPRLSVWAHLHKK